MISDQRYPLIEQFCYHNNQINLSSFNDPHSIWYKHIRDSLMLLTKRDLKNACTLLDVGTGGGFPLLPLAISCPWLMCTGCDSVRKKTQAVASIAKTLELTNVTVVWTRVENMTTQYDIVTARAVAYADKLLPLILPRLAPNGTIFLYKLRTEEENSVIMNYTDITITDILRYYDNTIPKCIYAIKKKEV